MWFLSNDSERCSPAKLGAKSSTILAFLLLALFSGAHAAPNNDFSVQVNTGSGDPDTVYPGQATSLRITLANDSDSIDLTNVNLNQALPTTATGGLRVIGAATISGTGCTGGTLTTTAGMADIQLSGLTVPHQDLGDPSLGTCYLDIPVAAWSSNGASTSHSYTLAAGAVSSDQGENFSGGPQAITVRAVTRPTWSKGFPSGNGTAILGGATETLRITVNNNDANVPLTNFGFVDVFPTSGADGAVIEPTGTPATGTCVGGAVNAVVGLTPGSAAQVAVSGGTLAPNSSCTIEVEIAARHTNGDYDIGTQNSINNASFTSDEGLQPSNNANRNITVRSPLAVSKGFAATPVASGVPSTFTVTLANNGNAPLTVVGFADDPISAAPYEDRLTATGVTNSCPGGIESIISGGQGFEASGFDIPANGSCTLTVDYTGLTPASDLPTTYTNNIPEGAVDVGVPGIISQQRSATVIVADRLRVLKSQSPTNVAPGNPVRYQVTVQNFSDTDATNVTVADQLQNGATLLTNGGFAPTLSAGCGVLDLNGRVEGDNDLLFSIPTLPQRTDASTPGVCTITFWAMIDPNSTIDTSNQIAACAVQINGNAADCNGSASQQVNANHQAVISLEKTFDGEENRALSEGTVSRMRIEVSNYSDNPLSTVAIGDTFPTGGSAFQQLRVASPANPGNTCGGTVTAIPGDTSVSLNGGAVSARNSSSNAPGRCYIEVNVVGPAGVYPNTATVSAIQANADGTFLPVNTNDTATLTYNDALNTTKSFSPASVGPGGESTARIRLSNLDANRPITGIRVEDSLPANMVIATPANAYTTCNGSTVVTAIEGGSTVLLEGASLAPSATCDLLFNVAVTGTADWTNTLEPGDVTADGGLLNRTDVSATLTYVAPSVPVISKSIVPGNIAPGESAQLTITITNSTQELSNLRLADYFTDDGLVSGVANGMTIASSAQVSTSCPGGVVSAVPGGDQVLLSGANLAANAVCTVSVNVSSSQVGTITNTIPMNSIETNEGATNSTTLAQSTLSTSSGVGINKNFTPKVVAAGAVSRLRITFLNTRDESLSGFDVVDTMPAGLEVAANPNPFSNCGGGAVITWPGNNSVQMTNGNLGPAIAGEAATCYLEIDVFSSTEGSYVNTIPANAITISAVPVDHPETTDTLEVRQHILVNKAIGGFTLDAGNPVGFTTGSANRLPGVAAPLVIRLENPNDIELTQVSVTDLLPEGLVVGTVPNIQTTCTNAVVSAPSSSRDIIATGITLAATGNAGSSCTVSVNVLSNIPGTYVNEIPVGGVTSFEEIENEEPTQAELIVSEPGTLGKQFEPPVIPPNGVSRLTITINNNNEANMVLSAPLEDVLPVLPSQMEVAAPANLFTSCPDGNAAIQANAGATSVVLDNGAIIPPGGCRIEVDVTAPDAGDYLNSFAVGALQSNFGPNEDPVNAPLLVSTLGYISGKVFLDNQAVPDGLFIPGDSTPIANNIIELRSGATCSDALLETQQTDTQGNYLFAELPAGSYSVCQPVQPSNTLNSITTEGVITPYNGSGGTVGTPGNPSVTTSQIVAIELTNSGDAQEVSGSPNNNFSEVLPASIAGNVYHDRNNDGVIDAGEEGIGNVTITLTNTTNAQTLVTQTAADGSYSFTDLPPGEYTVTETHPNGWLDGMDTAGSHAGDDTVDDVISAVVLAPGDDATEYNFGEFLTDGTALDGLSLQLNSYCDNDMFMVDYEVLSNGLSFDSPGPQFTISWFTAGGRLVEQLVAQASNGTLLWPGTEVDGSGDPVSWPGWSYVAGEWVEVVDDRTEDLTIRIESPEAEALAEYPTSLARCAAQPPGTFRGGEKGAPTLSFWMLLALSLFMVGTTYHWRRSHGMNA
ncbi:DUF7933 domain-containing protein [Gilvimarinus polysaccharolyticus]|uniref:DUF7933 domain-containing protein n=1 Tax=Gilvimarinus polysaccharolyticus TaxID=863921 RepID=UPI00067379E1|nr:SdrD B-like domain-containing protein [Gilvimarinus polysaccharolyticus]